MAKDETTPGGLFSKVVKFVRNPSTNWTELDTKESDRESAYSKQALKEMIERKRRNDFVRKREFDMLRKLRRREAMGLSGQGDGSARPSFFQSSMPSKPDDRAMTLKKIDEIEAQMSMQWWKTKHGNASSVPAAISSFPNSDMANTGRSEYPNGAAAKSAATNNQAYAPTAADDLSNALAAGAARARAAEPTPRMPPPPIAVPARPAVAATPTLPVARVQQAPPAGAPAAASAPLPAPAPAPAAAAPARQAAPPPQATPAAAAPAGAVAAQAKIPIMGGMASYDGAAVTGFSTSKMFAVEVDDILHDPELEEAAIRFANGDDAGAEAGLLEALGPTGTRGKHEETWFAAFDLYRATAQNDRFESLAIDFASKFNRSAPMWFSMPEQVGLMAKPATVAAPAVNQKSDWRCPSNLGVQSLAALNAALARAPMPWSLDWSTFKTIDENAVVPLTKLFASWAITPVQLRFLGAGNLDKVLHSATPSNESSVSQDLWKLRLAQLRITHRPDEFELAALDFCVTYEVSPPSWESARCEFKNLDADGQANAAQTIIGEAVYDSVQSEFSGYEDSLQNFQPSAQVTQLTSVELSGQIYGDPVAMLDKLGERLEGADVMVISCAKLIRVDFSAAGTLLNWVSARQGEGRLVQFTEVHRLVASFFHVIGISEHAKVIARND